jgi:hypothetical protein
LGFVVAIAFALPSGARAQNAPPFDPAIDVQTFEYAIGPKTFVTVADGDVAARHQLAVDALVTFVSKPFQIYNVGESGMVTGTRTTVVSSMTSAQLTAAYGMTDRFQLGFNLPIIFALQGDGLMPGTGTASPDGLDVTGLGDLVIEAKYRLVRTEALRLSAIGGLSLPSSIGSGGAQFIGDDLPTVRGKLAAQIDSGRMSFGANAGVLLRKARTIYDSTIGQQLTWGVAGAVRITNRLSLIAEGYGRAGLPDFALDASPLEVEGGVRLYVTGDVAVLVGGGAGIINGIGAPESRFFISLGYAPDVRDTDGDGIANGRDRCPLIAEDKDRFEDDDGCADDDNDGDHRPDPTDKCPNQSEDLDGFEDDDGCAELDNDKDGIADLQDKCANDAEDGKLPYAKDGCPLGKGAPAIVPDADPVPEVAAVCAAPDRDRDGIADAQDQCAGEAETVNGVADDDGCPDAGGVEVVRFADDRLSIDRVPSLDARKLSRGGEIIVDQMALVMRAHADVTKWLVAIAMPSAKTAQQVAAAVTARLVAQGVPADRITIVTAAGKSKIGGVAQDRAAPDARCAP